MVEVISRLAVGSCSADLIAWINHGRRTTALRALREAGVKVVFVTHLYDLAEGLRREGSPETLFLRAERAPDGRRTFRIVEGDPLPTSYGGDLYRQVFGDAPRAAGATASGE